LQLLKSIHVGGRCLAGWKNPRIGAYPPEIPFKDQRMENFISTLFGLSNGHFQSNRALMFRDTMFASLLLYFPNLPNKHIVRTRLEDIGKKFGYTIQDLTKLSQDVRSQWSLKNVVPQSNVQAVLEAQQTSITRLSTTLSSVEHMVAVLQKQNELLMQQNQALQSQLSLQEKLLHSSLLTISSKLDVLSSHGCKDVLSEIGNVDELELPAKRARVITPVSSSSSDNLGEVSVASFYETSTSMHEDETHDTTMHIDGIQGDSDQAVQQPRVLNNEKPSIVTIDPTITAFQKLVEHLSLNWSVSFDWKRDPTQQPETKSTSSSSSAVDQNKQKKKDPEEIKQLASRMKLLVRFMRRWMREFKEISPAVDSAEFLAWKIRFDEHVRIETEALLKKL
jgi:hypothetical protein